MGNRSRCERAPRRDQAGGIPALVRSEISARSSCATAPRICRENMPCGVDVSIGPALTGNALPCRSDPRSRRADGSPSVRGARAGRQRGRPLAPMSLTSLASAGRALDAPDPCSTAIGLAAGRPELHFLRFRCLLVRRDAGMPMRRCLVFGRCIGRVSFALGRGQWPSLSTCRQNVSTDCQIIDRRTAIRSFIVRAPGVGRRAAVKAAPRSCRQAERRPCRDRRRSGAPVRGPRRRDGSRVRPWGLGFS